MKWHPQSEGEHLALLYYLSSKLAEQVKEYGYDYFEKTLKQRIDTLEKIAETIAQLQKTVDSLETLLIELIEKEHSKKIRRDRK